MEAQEERTLGARLKELRLARALTQVEVSEKAGLALDAVSKIETGRRRPRPGTVRKLAEALGVGVEELTGKGSSRRQERAEIQGMPELRLAALGEDAEEYEVWQALAETRAEAEGISKGDALWRLVDEQTILARAGRRRKPRLRSPEEMPHIVGEENAAAAVAADRQRS